MGRCNNRRAQERAAQQRNVPSRARFSKGPPKKNGGRGGRGGRSSNDNGGRGGRGGRGRGGRTSTNDAVVKRIQERVTRKSQDIGGISLVTKKKKKSPLAGVDVSKLDTVVLSAESVAVVERLLKAYNVWDETNNDDHYNDEREEEGDIDANVTKQMTASTTTSAAMISLDEDEDMYDDYCGDYDDEPGEQCGNLHMNKDDGMHDSSNDQVDNEINGEVEENEFRDSSAFIHLTQHYSFTEQDVVHALNASARRMLLSEKSSGDGENITKSSPKSDGILLEMAMDWLSLHLNESDLRHGFRVKSKRSSTIDPINRMMANTIPLKYKAVPHESISIMPKLTQTQYEKESREALLEWKRQQLTTELIRMGFHSLEMEKVFTFFENEMEMILDRIPESNHDELQLLSILEDKVFEKLVECIEVEVCGESTDNTDVDEEIDELATMERDQEKEVLEAIYAESFQNLHDISSNDESLGNRYLLLVNPTTPLQPPARNDKCYLHVLTRPGYPLVSSPMVWFFNASLPPSLLRRMNVSLIRKAREQLGQASVYELMEYLAENITLWQQEFIDEEASAEKATVTINDRVAKIDVNSDDEEIDYFTTTFTAEERKKLSRRQRQKLKAAEKLYSRDEIILEKERVKKQNDEERRKRVQFENKTVSTRMADKEINKRWYDFVHDEAEKASRKAMNDAFLRGEGREDARAAAETARLGVLRFHGELDENNQSNTTETSPSGSSSIKVISDADENKANDADLPPTNASNSETTPKTLLFVEKLRKMYEQKAKEKSILLSKPSTELINPTAHVPTPVVAPSPGVEEVLHDIAYTQQNQPWLIAQDARVPMSSEKNNCHSSETVSIVDMTKKEKTNDSLRAALKKKKQSGSFKKMLLQRARLPTYKMKNDLIETIRNSQVTVVSGDTGCGKTTQLPQLVLDDMIENNMGSDANIIVTQPRRISAIGVADRIATERGEKVGQTVGYSIRLDSRRSPKTRLLLCTTGVLLRRLQVDPDLASVSHVFVDEVHERDLNTDFLLIILRDLLYRRKSIKLILMSATLNAERFSEYFGAAPIMNIPGRAQPVKQFRLEDALEVTGHLCLEDSEYAVKKTNDDNKNRMSKTSLRRMYPNYSKNVITSLANVDESVTNYELIGDLLEYICTLEEDGAILVFLSGIGEIKSAMEEINKRESLSDSAVIFPLHSSLSNDEQTAIFQRPPEGKRKIVLSSNIAETSITIDDVVFVIDTGRVKENRYDDLNKMPTLQECWVSKASARQRRGRAGRVKPGFCWHLFSSHTHDTVLDDYQLPEMLRVGLEDLMLQILILDLGSPAAFLAKAVNPPSELSVRNALQLLESIGAAETQWGETSDTVGPASLTALGYHLATLPVHARIGKMMIMGSLFGVFDSCLTIAAAMTCRNPFISSFDNRDAADEAKRTFASDDHLATLLAFNQWRELKRKDGRKSRAFLRENYLSYQSLSNIVQLRNQLKRYMNDIGFVAPMEKNIMGDDELCLIRAVISAAMYPNVIVAPRKISTTAGETPFRGQNGEEVYLHPSTIAFNAKELGSRYCCYHEICKTSKVYVRDCTTVSKFSLLLFGGSLKVYQNKGVVAVDEWLKFRCDAKPATLVKYLRQQMETLLLEKIMDPSIDISRSDKGRTVIDSVASLLKMES